VLLTNLGRDIGYPSIPPSLPANSGIVNRIGHDRFLPTRYSPNILPFGDIQGVPGAKVNILGGHGIGHSKQKKIYVHVTYPKRFLRSVSMYSSLDLAPKIVLPSHMRIGVKRQLAVVTVDSDTVGVL
jgi:hypothetical protein